MKTAKIKLLIKQEVSMNIKTLNEDKVFIETITDIIENICEDSVF